MKSCRILGILPHPQLSGEKRPFSTLTGAVQGQGQGQTQTQTQAQGTSHGRKASQVHIDHDQDLPRSHGMTDGHWDSTAHPNHVDEANLPAPVVTSKRGSLTNKTNGPLLPAKPSNSTSSVPNPNPNPIPPAPLSKEEKKAAEEALIQREIKVFGWKVDGGTMAALQMTLPYCKGLTTLRLWNAGLSSQSISILSDALKTSTIQRLYLDFNPLNGENEDGSVFSLLISTPSPLQMLSLRGNQINDRIGSEIFQSLIHNKNLLALDLWENQLTHAIGEIVAKTILLNNTLVALALNKNRLGDAGCHALAHAFSCVAVEKEEAKNLKKDGYKMTALKNKFFRDANGTLRVLNLADNAVGDAGVSEWIRIFAEQSHREKEKDNKNGDKNDKEKNDKNKDSSNGVESEPTTDRSGGASRSTSSVGKSARDRDRSERDKDRSNSNGNNGTNPTSNDKDHPKEKELRFPGQNCKLERFIVKDNHFTVNTHDLLLGLSQVVIERGLHKTIPSGSSSTVSLAHTHDVHQFTSSETLDHNE